MAKGEQKYVVFKVADERFGLPIESVERILSEQKVTRVPRCPAIMIGVFDLRGETLAVIDLRKRFEYQEEPRIGNFIVVQCAGDRLACRVDSVEGIYPISEEDVNTDCEFIMDKGDDFLYGVAKNGEDLVVILNPDGVIPAQVRQKAVKLAA